NRIDDGNSDLAGAWRITDRMRNGEMQAMQLGARKTIKMITGSRFQWAAFNPETKQFSGTGGGKVTLKDGKYSEHIEFFSRNPDRVGADLTFNYEVNGDKWTHSGLSSSGDPIKEIWTRQ
ncbi:MAG: membrane or secreted protein, partial [Roseivirga sp.]|nr:membrane or secreted protein [Roseivirga sp.]